MVGWISLALAAAALLRSALARESSERKEADSREERRRDEELALLREQVATARADQERQQQSDITVAEHLRRDRAHNEACRAIRLGARAGIPTGPAS